MMHYDGAVGINFRCNADFKHGDCDLTQGCAADELMNRVALEVYDFTR
jgi:hypothetical protein